MLMFFSNNFANVFRKWKTIWIFEKLAAEFCENFPKIFETEKYFIIRFIFSIHALIMNLLSATGVRLRHALESGRVFWVHQLVA